MRVYKHYKEDRRVILFHGDCKKLLKEIPDDTIDLVITSPPYCMKKAYEDPNDDINTFKAQHLSILGELYRVLKPEGSLCWQVGYHVSEECVVPLDYIIYELFTSFSSSKEHPLQLQNRIVWTFGHGLNSMKRFSGRHEVILWFTKGKRGCFNLDDIRIPQKYPGKKSYKGPKKGELSGHPLGKNPSDVWDIPNVKANHVEKTDHPCQFPVALPARLIKALSPVDGVVLDPFAGAGTSGVAAILSDRRFIGAEIQDDYFGIATDRLKKAISGTIVIREDKPAIQPNKNSAVATLPVEFIHAREEKKNGKI